MTPEWNLKDIRVWQRLEKAWKALDRRFYDKAHNEILDPTLHHNLLISLLKSKANDVNQLAFDTFLLTYGISQRFINRHSSKKFLPDGSWISNGVRFGP